MFGIQKAAQADITLTGLACRIAVGSLLVMPLFSADQARIY